jgi:hypothetical protein
MFHNDEFRKEFNKLVSSWYFLKNQNEHILVLKTSWGGGQIRGNTVSYTYPEEDGVTVGNEYCMVKKTPRYMGPMYDDNYYNGTLK